MVSTGSVLKGLREAARLSQQELADKTGIDRSTISQLENDKFHLTEDRMDKLSNTLAEFTDLAYVAGLFDRASCLGITKLRVGQVYNAYGTRVSPHYRVRVNFTSKHKILVEVINRVFGVGKVCPQKNYRGGQPYYMFYAGSANAEDVLRKLLPYLRVKRSQVELILQLREIINFNRHNRQGSMKVVMKGKGKGAGWDAKKSMWFGLPQSTVDKMEEIYQEFLKVKDAS